MRNESNIVKNKSKSKNRNRRFINRNKDTDKINLVHNFSSISLSKEDKSLLNKGLNFCPQPKGINRIQFEADMMRLKRKMAWRDYFGDNCKKEEKSNPFKKHKKQICLRHIQRKLMISLSPSNQIY